MTTVRKNEPRMRDEAEHQEGLAAGEALKRIRDRDKANWEDTKLIAAFLTKVHRDIVEATGARKGAKYTQAMSARLEYYELDDIHETRRADLIKIGKNLEAVDKWRNDQPNKDDLNNPSTVWRNYSAWLEDEEEKKRREAVRAAAEKAAAGEPVTPAPVMPEPATEAPAIAPDPTLPLSVRIQNRITALSEVLNELWPHLNEEQKLEAVAEFDRTATKLIMMARAVEGIQGQYDVDD
jgi:hypothetical protein